MWQSYLKVQQCTLNLLCLKGWPFLIAISAKQPGTNACCILVEKKKFFDISLRGTPVDWKTLLLITEVTVQHTNLKFSEESKLCSTSQKSTHTQTHTNKSVAARISVFPNIKRKAGCCRFLKKAIVLSYTKLTFSFFSPSLLFVRLQSCFFWEHVIWSISWYADLSDSDKSNYLRRPCRTKTRQEFGQP